MTTAMEEEDYCNRESALNIDHKTCKLLNGQVGQR